MKEKIQLLFREMDNKIIVSFLAIIIITTVSICGSIYSIDALIANSSLRGHTYQVIEASEKLASMLKDVETGQRGYLLTGEERYLEPYYASKDLVDEQAERLKSLAITNSLPPEQFDKLIEVINKKIAEMERTVKTYKEQGYDVAVQIVRSGNGKLLMDDIREKIDKIKADEIKILEVREARVILGGKIVFWTIIVSGISAAVLVVFSSWRFAEDFNKQYITSVELQKSEARLRTINESLRDSVIIADARGMIVSFNNSTCQMFGYTKEELTNKPLTLLMPDRYKKDHLKGLATLQKTGIGKLIGETIESEAIRKNKQEFPIELGISSWKANGNQFYTGIIRDITERKTAEELAKHYEQRFRLIINNIQDYAIFMIDPSGNVSSWNSGAERIKGYKADEIIGKPISIFYTKDEVAAGKPQQDLDTALVEGRSESEGWRVKKDGTPFWATTVITPIYDENRLQGYAKITHDETNRKIAEDKIMQSYSEMEQFIYIASHDLQEPLRTITGFLQLIEKRYSDKLDKDGHEFIQFSVDGAKRMRQLILDLLSYSRIGRKQTIVKVDLNDVIKTTLDALHSSIEESKPNIKIAKMPFVWADNTQMGLLMQNLLSNAIKFHSDRPIEIEIGWKEKGDFALVWVKDNGIGIDPKFMERLFQIFQKFHGRDKYEGTGIGLAICKKIVDQYGGEIYAESKLGQGSTFYFTIPLKENKK